MVVHQHKTGKIKIRGTEYDYIYRQHDVIFGHDDLENIRLHDAVYELKITGTNWRRHFPDGTKLEIPSVVAGRSFENCVRKITELREFYAIAKHSETLDEAKETWYDRYH